MRSSRSPRGVPPNDFIRGSLLSAALCYTRHRVLSVNARRGCRGRSRRLRDCRVQPGDERAVVGGHTCQHGRAHGLHARELDRAVVVRRRPARRGFCPRRSHRARERQDGRRRSPRRRRIDQQRFRKLPDCSVLRRVRPRGSRAVSQRGAAARFRERDAAVAVQPGEPHENAWWRPQRPREFRRYARSPGFSRRDVCRHLSPSGTRHTHSSNGPLSPGAFPLLSAPLLGSLQRSVSLQRGRRGRRVDGGAGAFRARRRPDVSGELRAAPRGIAAIRARPEASRVFNSIAKALAAYRDPMRIEYIKLADGGLTDNFAVTTLVISRLVYGTPYAPMTERDAVKIRRLLLIVADASEGPNGDWRHQEAGPSGVDLARSATDAAVDSAARYVADALGRMVQEWQDSVIAFRCGLKPADVIRLGGPAQWNCSDVKFSLAYLSVDELDSPMRERIEAVPTRLTLEADQVDVAIQGARQGTLALRRLRTYLRDRVASGGR